MAFRDDTVRLLEGGCDLHIHPGPSHFERSFDDFTLLREADSYGMAGVMLKSHYEPTGARARLANSHAGAKRTVAYGSVTLNRPVGGLNPFAVEGALKMGAILVWMPTRDAENSLRYGDMNGDFYKRDGITVFDAQRRLLPVVGEILEVIRRYGATLATGHLDNEEILALCTLAREMKVKTVLTHPEWYRTRAPLELQLRLADMGVLIEKNWENLRSSYITAPEMADAIRKIGPARILWGSDASNAYTSPEAMLSFIEAMQGEGLADGDIRTMLCETPRHITG